MGTADFTFAAGAFTAPQSPAGRYAAPEVKIGPMISELSTSRETKNFSERNQLPQIFSSRDVIVPPTSNAVGLVQEEFPVAQRRFGVLVDGNDDRLDMVVAPTFARS